MRIPWGAVTRRARKFSEIYTDLLLSHGKIPDGGLPRETIREYIQSAWQCGFEAGRAARRKFERSKRDGLRRTQVD